MGLEDFFENDHKRHKQDRRHYDYDDKHHNNHYDNHQFNNLNQNQNRYSPHENNYSKVLLQQFLSKLQNNPRLKMLIIIGAVCLLLILILIAVLLLPLIINLFQYLSENGVEGALDTILKGTK